MTDLKMVLIVRKDLNMRKGKIAAQVAHAATNAILERWTALPFIVHHVELSKTQEVYKWLRADYKKIVVSVETLEELLAIKDKAEYQGINTHLQIDNGLTEFNGVKTETVLALGPSESELLDSITGHLKLL